MKIINLQSENIKRLTAVEIKPDGNLVVIAGKNGQGKTSVLDSIWWALAGTSNVQSQPIRKGAKTGRIRLDLGQMVVTRKFTANGSTITVENAEGAKFSSPQAMLDGLLSSLSFDPLKFSRMAAKEQFNELRKFVPEIDFDKIDRENKADFDKRSEINRRAKDSRAAASKIVITSNTAARVDEAALIMKLGKASERNTAIESERMKRKAFADKIAANKARIEQIMKEGDELIAKVVADQAKLDSAPPIPEPINVTEVQKKIAEAKFFNEQVDLVEKRDALVSEAEQFENQAQNLTLAMADRQASKEDLISKASLPVPGLSFGDGMILLNGVPFDQASDAEQLRTSIAIAMASNPKLRVIRVRDGSLLDENALKIVAEMAEKNDFQCWIERVGEGDRVGFILEDGHLKGIEQDELVDFSEVELS